jgi:hypothetical protein
MMTQGEFISYTLKNVKKSDILKRQKKDSEIHQVILSGPYIGIVCIVGKNGNTKKINLDDLIATYKLLISNQTILHSTFIEKLHNKNKPCVSYLILALLIKLELIIKVEHQEDLYLSKLYIKS